MTKEIKLNAFDMMSGMHNSHGLWKHPDSERHRRYTDLDYWVDMAKLLERGMFDAVFFADIAGVYDIYEGNKDPGIRDGVHFPINDASLVVSAMASVTEHLCFAVTVSTTYDHPFTNAKRFSTLDHLTKGRIAWNIVTSYLPNAARNFGLEKMVKHDERYDVAAEFLDVSYKLLEGSWEDGAVSDDAESKTFVEPSKVHAINHEGKYFNVEGPHLSEPSIQRTPVIYQAGSSIKGREFAAKNAECVFIGGATDEITKYYVDDIKERAAKHGRNPDHVQAFTFLTVIVAETTEEATAKYEKYNELWSPEAAKAIYGGSSGYDMAEYDDPDAFFEYKKTEHAHSSAVSLTKDQPKKLTVREVNERFDNINSNNLLVGNPIEIADAMEKKFKASGVDGFNLASLVSPSDLKDFIELVVPELQKRGLYKKEYKAGTFREKLFEHGSNLLPDDHPGSTYRRK